MSALRFVCLAWLAANVQASSEPPLSWLDTPSETKAVEGAWPSLSSEISTAYLTTRIDCFGHIGMMLIPGNPTIGWPTRDSCGFRTPVPTTADYLRVGGLWIGGIIGEDTLVTGALETWHLTGGEWLPPAFAESHPSGSVVPYPGPAEVCYWTQFADTLHPGFDRPPDFWGRPYRPLNLVVSLRTYAWTTGVAANVVLLDIVVTNVGRDTVRGGYAGIYLDPDVVGLRASASRVGDDMIGSLQSQGICYAIDNDGDPVGGRYELGVSPVRAIAYKMLAAWPPPVDTNFNWMWTTVASSFTPRQKTNNHPLSDWGPGHAKGDVEQYYLLQTKEWDYDQVLTGVAETTDSTWQRPDSAVAWFVKFGGDVRMLCSIGPYTLYPDSSIRMISTIFTGGIVHTDPNVLDLIGYYPEFYQASLNLSGLIAVASVADSLAAVVSDPAGPPMGLRLATIGGDSAVVEWDSPGSGNSSGTDFYVVEIPKAAYRDPGLPPMWYQPDQLPTPIRVEGWKSTVHQLDPYRAYACYVRNSLGDGAGRLSDALVVKRPTPVAAPMAEDTFCYVGEESIATIRWQFADQVPIAGFRVYRFADTVSASTRFAQFYSYFRRTDKPAADSFRVGTKQVLRYAMPVYAQLDPQDRIFVDSSACEGCVYVLSAVDTAGFESTFSPPIVTYRAPEKTKDILVLTNSGGTYSYVSLDTVQTFYRTILQGYDFDIFSYADSMANGNCPAQSPTCVDWQVMSRYKLVIVDDGLEDGIISSWYEDATSGFTHVLLSGGKLAYFGSLSRLGKALSPTLRPDVYVRTSGFGARFLGVDSVFYVGPLFYKLFAQAPYLDTICGFSHAEPIRDEAPEIRFDSTRNPFLPTLGDIWPVGTPPSVSYFVGNNRATVTHVARSIRPESSRIEGKPAGLRINNGVSEGFAFGFHLWYMDRTDARALVDWLMEQVPTDVPGERDATLPRSVALHQNYPNPFNPATTIAFELPVAGNVRLEVFNILGQKVRLLVDEQRIAGHHQVVWDGRNESGKMVSTGIYLYRLQAYQAVLTKKMLLIK